MSETVLIETLRAKGREQARDIWREAEAEAERIQSDALHKIEALEAECRREESLAHDVSAKSILVEAERTARKRRAAAKHQLASRLYELALACLSSFREDAYEDLFARLAAELPAVAWEEVRANPADQSLARRSFPDARVSPDETITGGMEAVDPHGGLRVINTLEKRLERGWAEILPGIFKQIDQEALKHETRA